MLSRSRARRLAARLLAVLVGVASVIGSGPLGAEEEIEARLDAILSSMTLEEKIGQLNLVPNSPSFDFGQVERGLVGSVVAFNNPRDVAGVQAAARRSRFGIPLLVGLDVLHGLRTMFPLPMAEAGSFDPDLARRTATMAGREAAASGVNWTFAPMADLARDPRWGRMIEGFGEDPLLGQLFTRARVEGFRAAGLATTLKHFAGYGAGVGGRDYDAASIAPADLYNSYFPPFRAGIEAGSESVMSAFLSLNGVPVSANPALLTGILRDRWRYDGFVVSDWDAVRELIEHGVAADGAAAARAALLAGLDVDMNSGLYAAHLPGEVAAGRVPEARVTQAARRVLRAKLRMGLAERAAPTGTHVDPPAPSPDALALAREAARDSMVLLRNEGVLPLRGGQRLAVIGALAASQRNLVGPHAALVRFEDGVTILDGLRERAEASQTSLAFSPGCDLVCTEHAGFEAALQTARAADVVVAVLGETNEMSGEAASRARLTLPGRQPELLQRLVETGKPVVLVMQAGRPIEIGPIVDRLAAVLMAWFPGTEGGHAAADLLFGDANPSAKLPVTWPRTVGQVPLTYDQARTGRPHDPANNYTLRYVDEALTPLFPFGFGQSYTRFSLEGIEVATPRVGSSGTLEIRTRLANVGARAGREVVQLYVRQTIAKVSRPGRQLKVFAKVALEPGASQAVSLKVPASDLGYFREDGSYVLEPGEFQVFLGTSSDTVLSGTFEVTP